MDGWGEIYQVFLSFLTLKSHQGRNYNITYHSDMVTSMQPSQQHTYTLAQCSYLVEGNERFRVDTNQSETGTVAEEELSEEAQEDRSDCLVLEHRDSGTSFTS